MKLIAGLGNPGIEYHYNRHNIGFRIIDYIADKEKVKFRKRALYRYILLNNKALLIKSNTFMNLTGEAVRKAMKDFQIDELLLVYDDIYLPMGTLRIRQNGSDGGHKGIRSVIGFINEVYYINLKIGVGSATDSTAEVENRTDSSLSEYVLQNFSDQEEKELSGLIGFSHKLIMEYINNDYSGMINYYSKNKNILSCSNCSNA